jgi:hypothetical protein
MVVAILSIITELSPAEPTSYIRYYAPTTSLHNVFTDVFIKNIWMYELTKKRELLN